MQTCKGLNSLMMQLKLSNLKSAIINLNPVRSTWSHEVLTVNYNDKWEREGYSKSLIPTDCFSKTQLMVPGYRGYIYAWDRHWKFQLWHDDVIKWKHFTRYWPFVRGIHRWPVNSPHKGQWRGTLMFSFICVWINDWVNNSEAGDLRRHRGHYDVTVMIWKHLYKNVSDTFGFQF